ncbi:MAG: alpha/beta hydrolase [Burkholderiaceae bacterium]|nr:alpha/beta hydrolase [Burkholderiaceae bacterium]
MIQFVDTPALRIAYRTGGDPHATPLLLLHGWPDDASAFDAVAPALQQAGWRTFAPWQRGCGSTEFRTGSTLRSGETAALVQDALDFASALQLQRFAVVGHDWGARVAYLLAAVEPQRVMACAALSVPFEPGVPATPPLRQAQAFWYQWFLTTERGAEVLRRGGKAFARFQWHSWSPPGWFDDVAFDQVARSFENPDWVAVTLHACRERWGEAEPDPTHADLARRLREARRIAVPTLMVQGGSDRVVLPHSSESKEVHFSGPYQRHLLEGVGHFPTREAPHQTAGLLTSFLGQHPR